LVVISRHRSSALVVVVLLLDGTPGVLVGGGRDVGEKDGFERGA
jgi:hypothetical protein